MTILIVDDEWYAVKGISQGIDWASHGVSCVLEAFDAAQAMQLMDEQTVDAMICDIEMQECNGIELAQWTVAHHPNVRIVFLTGHAQFAYANQALKLKAFDYLLKPVAHEQLVATVCLAIKDAQDALELQDDAARWKQYSAKQAQQAPERTRLFWRNVIDNRLSRESIHAWLSMQDVHISQPGLVTPVALWLGDGSGDSTTRQEELVSFVLGQKLDEQVLGSLEGCRLEDPEMDALLLIYGLPTAINSKLSKLFSALEADLGRKLNYKVGEATAPETLWWSVRCMRTDFARIVPSAKGTEHFDWVSALSTLPSDVLHARADRLFANLNAENNDILVSAEICRLRGAALLLAGSATGTQRELSLINSPPDSAQLTKLMNWVHQIIDICVQAAAYNGDNALIASACQYIRTHLASDLSRDAIAAQVYLHPTYLSRLFKYEMGVTLSDYITNERIAYACKLLSEQPGIKTSIVALQVGYPQSTYFCRVFRRTTGMSPQEYQQNPLPMDASARVL